MILGADPRRITVTTGNRTVPIPIQRALQDGAIDITVVLTHNPSFRLKPMPRWLGRLAYAEFPAVARAWPPSGR